MSKDPSTKQWKSRFFKIFASLILLLGAIAYPSVRASIPKVQQTVAVWVQRIKVSRPTENSTINDVDPGLALKKEAEDRWYKALEALVRKDYNTAIDHLIVCLKLYQSAWKISTDEPLSDDPVPQPRQEKLIGTSTHEWRIRNLLCGIVKLNMDQSIRSDDPQNFLIWTARGIWAILWPKSDDGTTQPKGVAQRAAVLFGFYFTYARRVWSGTNEAITDILLKAFPDLEQYVQNEEKIAEMLAISSEAFRDYYKQGSTLSTRQARDLAIYNCI